MCNYMITVPESLLVSRGNIFQYLKDVKIQIEHMEQKWVKTGMLDKVNEKIFMPEDNTKDTLKWIVRNDFGNISDFLEKIDNIFNTQVDIIIKEEEEKERREKEKQHNYLNQFLNGVPFYYHKNKLFHIFQLLIFLILVNIQHMNNYF